MQFMYRVNRYSNKQTSTKSIGKAGNVQSPNPSIAKEKHKKANPVAHIANSYLLIDRMPCHHPQKV